MDSKVSVVIPTYNRAHPLAGALESVFAQTRRADQVVVVDDGSEDETERVLAPLSHRIVYRRIQHQGASAARNAGLDVARGDYVAFLDSDDLWEPRFLERTMAGLDNCPDAGFVFCDYATCTSHGIAQPANLPLRYKRRGLIFALLLETDFLSTGTLLIRRSCFERIGGFDPQLEIAQDWDLWLRLAHEFTAEYIDEPLALIRIDSDGLTRNTPLLYSNNLRILSKLDGQVEGEEQRRIVRQNRLACHRALFRSAWGARQPFPMLKHLSLMITAQFL